MKRPRILNITLVIFVLALVFVSTFTSRTAKAEEPCDSCMRAVQAQFEACEAAGGGQICYENFNTGVVICYMKFCEQ